MVINQALLADIPEINDLVNSAYRGDESKKGWTTEADLFEGGRTDESMLTEYFQQEGATILKGTDENGQMIGVVYLEKKGTKLYLGMLTVAPGQQARGVGKALLEASELFAKEQQCDTVTMTVISSRKELVSWYERRGYTFTGESFPFDKDNRYGTPKDAIEMIVMEKTL